LQRSAKEQTAVHTASSSIAAKLRFELTKFAYVTLTLRRL